MWELLAQTTNWNFKVFLSPENGSKSIPTKLTSSDTNFWTPWRRPIVKKKNARLRNVIWHWHLPFAKITATIKWFRNLVLGSKKNGWRMKKPDKTFYFGTTLQTSFSDNDCIQVHLDNFLQKELSKKDWPVQCDLAPCTLPRHLMLQRRVGRSGPCTQRQQYPYY